MLSHYKICRDIQDGVQMAVENKKLNISDCMADKTEIPSAWHTFLWSRNAMETKLIAI